MSENPPVPPGVERLGEATEPSDSRVPPLRTCVQDGQIVCVDDLCRNSSWTLCGLEEGIDFGVDLDDDYPADDDRWCQECGCVEYECHCDQPVFP